MLRKCWVKAEKAVCLADLLVRRRLWESCDGQDLIEYALLAAFFSLTAAFAFPRISDSVGDIFERVRSELRRARLA